MANQEQLDILSQGSKIWNAWRWYAEGHKDGEIGILVSDIIVLDIDLQRANLSSIDLSHANLSSVNLSDANLSSTNLSHADLGHSDLRGANLSNADLSNANLREANLSNANLRYIQLKGTDLYATNFNSTDLLSTTLIDVDFRNSINLNHASLYSANLSGAQLGETVFAYLDLRQAKGLLDLFHAGPSHIDLHTVQLPQDGSGSHFLQGAGIPNAWIDFYLAQIMLPVQYYSCFISYSSKDSVFAHRLQADLQNHGVRCWFAPKDMKVGDKIRLRIDEAIHLQDKLLLLLSKHAIASTWVEDEVEAALEKERRQQREVLFPIYLDESVMHTSQAWAAKLRRTYYIGDFTHWTDPLAYQLAFERLLRDLKAENEVKGKTDGKPGAS